MSAYLSISISISTSISISMSMSMCVCVYIYIYKTSSGSWEAEDSRAGEAALATHPCSQAAGQWKAGQVEVEGHGPCLVKAMTAMKCYGDEDDVKTMNKHHHWATGV